jgi:hypothetical protein
MSEARGGWERPVQPSALVEHAGLFRIADLLDHGYCALLWRWTAAANDLPGLLCHP